MISAANSKLQSRTLESPPATRSQSKMRKHSTAGNDRGFIGENWKLGGRDISRDHRHGLCIATRICGAPHSAQNGLPSSTLCPHCVARMVHRASSRTSFEGIARPRQAQGNALSRIHHPKGTVSLPRSLRRTFVRLVVDELFLSPTECFLPQMSPLLAASVYVDQRETRSAASLWFQR